MVKIDDGFKTTFSFDFDLSGLERVLGANYVGKSARDGVNDRLRSIDKDAAMFIRDRLVGAIEAGAARLGKEWFDV